jgi:hypothetical protein
VRTYTSLWLIRMLTYELNELFMNVELDLLRRSNPRTSLKQFTGRVP